LPVEIPKIGLDMGIFAVKGVLEDNGEIKTVSIPNSGSPLEAARKCLKHLLKDNNNEKIKLGVTGSNSRLLAREAGLDPVLEVEALQMGLGHINSKVDSVLSLGHENMYYLELGNNGTVEFFNRNGQCAAGSGSFWYQQATRMGFDDKELAEVALEAEDPVKISGRCAVFAKSDMTHAINEGASQAAVSAGMAKALVDLVVTNVAQNRIKGPGKLAVIGGVANNRAVMKYLKKHCRENGIEVVIPSQHEFINAMGAAFRANSVTLSSLSISDILNRPYKPNRPLPPLDPDRVHYMEPPKNSPENFNLDFVYLGVDCGSVSTKCSLLDADGKIIGGVYLPTAGRPALQVLELMKKVRENYGDIIGGAPIKACTTGSGRFLSQKILNAEYAVDEITCQAEGVKYLYGNDEDLAIIEIGGEDSKFLQLNKGILFDYNMNPVCAAGTGTFLENLAELLGVKIKGEFSQKAFTADFGIDLGDTCTLLSQSALVSAASRGLPLSSQLASLAYSSARNYLNKTAENRALEGRLVFTGATAKNHALAAAFAGETGREIHVPANPELTGALGSALMAKFFSEKGDPARFAFRSLDRLNSFQVDKKKCTAQCEHEHNCTLDIITFDDKSSFIYGDRCGRFSDLEKSLEGVNLPDFISSRNEIFAKAAGEPRSDGPSVGLARAGLNYDLYPFFAAFFRELGARVVQSKESDQKTLEWGKQMLNSDMCYPMEIIVGHYKELKDKDLDFIFIPEPVDMEAIPWFPNWPRGFTCSLLQTLDQVVAKSVDIEPEKHLYAQLNFRKGKIRIEKQLEPVARKLLGNKFSRENFKKAVNSAFSAREQFSRDMENEAARIFEELKNYPDEITAVFLGRSYTLYDDFVAKGSLEYARKRGLLPLNQDHFFELFRGFYEGRIKSAILEPYREELIEYMKDVAEKTENIYPFQVQKMLTAAIMARFLNTKVKETGLPIFNIVFQDPFKCGPNAMLRHFLGNITGFLRLTLDEHTAPAGLITRLEAFKNTCRARRDSVVPSLLEATTHPISSKSWERIYIPEPTRHASVFKALFRNKGIDARILPRSSDSDMTKARKFVNGEECLPFIQNVQDFLEFIDDNPEVSKEKESVFFQGWACGPCRYGMYAPAQSLILNKAGHGGRRICSIKIDDVFKRFGLGFVIASFDGMLAMDILYKMLFATRPYEDKEGVSDHLFLKYSNKLLSLLEHHGFSTAKIIRGALLGEIEKLLAEASEKFQEVRGQKPGRPQIVLAGEFYVRIDDRCNQEIARRIEAAGGEVLMSPATEIFTYTAHITRQEAREALYNDRNLGAFLTSQGYGWMLKLAHGHEMRMEKAAGELLADQHEPTPAEIQERALPYVSKHYGGEPPMTIGRTACFSDRPRVGGAIFVAPFTCMPGSIVEAQQNALQAEIDIPVISIYYDGREDSNREEFIESLVYQAGQKIKNKNKSSV